MRRWHLLGVDRGRWVEVDVEQSADAQQIPQRLGGTKNKNTVPNLWRQGYAAPRSNGLRKRLKLSDASVELRLLGLTRTRVIRLLAVVEVDRWMSASALERSHIHGRRSRRHRPIDIDVLHDALRLGLRIGHQDIRCVWCLCSSSSGSHPGGVPSRLSFTRSVHEYTKGDSTTNNLVQQ